LLPRGGFDTLLEGVVVRQVRFQNVERVMPTALREEKRFMLPLPK
jgi:hypothetical protein